MSRKPPASPQEMWEIAVRRKWWIAIPAVLVPALVIWIGTRLPRQYESNAVVMVDPQKIPTEFVRPGSDTTERLEVIQEEVVSQPRLEAIAMELGLAGRVGAERAANSIRKNMDVEVLKAGGDDSPITGYKITFTGSSPAVAQAVTARIANLFVEENQSWSSQEAVGTHQFLSDQLAKAKAQLDAQQEKLEEFKAAHLGALPEQEASNLALIGQYQNLLQANSEAIDRASQQKVYLESLLDASQGSAHGVASAPSPLQVELQKAKDQLAAARQIYTDSYPDVVALRQQVASLEQQLKNEPKQKSSELTASTGPTMLQQLQSQLLAVQQEIEERTERQAALQVQLKSLQGQVQVVPEVQSQYEQLNQDFTELQKNYESLLEKQQSAGMAAELQQTDNRGGFQIVDPATLPLVPSGPNLLIINSAGIVGGILLGCLIGLIVDLSDATIHNCADLERYVELPMIISLPNFEKGAAGTKRSASVPAS